MLDEVTHIPVTFVWPAALWIGGAICAMTILVAALRRPAVPGRTKTLVLLGMGLLCLASAGPVWRRPASGEVAVMVDLSPSTRSADYRTRAMLESRVRQLVGGVPFRMYFFADGLGPASVASADSGRLPDVAAEMTRYEPPDAAAVLLFSDGQFEVPAAEAAGPPTYPVIDIGLEDPRDAAVASLEVRGDSAAAVIRNTGPDRQFTLSGMSGTSPTTAPAGEYVISRHLDPSAGAIAARLGPGDAWPENDGLSAPVPPPRLAEKWLVDGSGEMAAPPGWRVLPPEALPTHPAAYLVPEVIVLNDVPAGRLSPDRQDRLRQYVRDLGGGLVLLGGPHAFAAGEYPGSTLESLSPLASTPPRPTTHWILLADGSGSMNGAAEVPGTTAAASLWHYASEAIVKVLPLLPPDDRVSVGSFAEEATWWSANRSARDTAALPLPPPNAVPHGPTNLRPALDAITAAADPTIPNELLLLTDADADMGDPASLAEGMKARHVRLFLLALGEGRGLAALEQIAVATGGRVLREGEAGKWGQAVEQLMRWAGPNLLETAPLAVHFTGDLSDEPDARVSPWNHAWLKAAATGMAEAEFAGARITPAGEWNVGEGRVLSAAFQLPADAMDRLAMFARRPPRDPRFRVNWETGPNLRVSVDALSPDSADTSGGNVYLNDLKLTLHLSPAGAAAGGPGESLPMTQTGPGKYELAIPAPRLAAFATVQLDNAGTLRTLDRFAVAGRYAPEFDAIGNNFGNLRTLAERTGGAIIPPRQATAIDFRWPPHDVPAGSWLAAAGAVFIALGLIAWRV